MKPSQIIIGIDPGARVTGYGIIRLCGNKCTALDYGCITPSAKAKLSDRYLIIYNSLEFILNKFEPDVLVVELQYVGKNVKSALVLAQVRGIAILAAKKRNLPVYEYTPSSVKKAVGAGNASKRNVQELVKMLLGLDEIPEPNDAADALAVALCHSNAATYSQVHQWEI